ncbi:MAG: protein-glutamate O-methyltransferase CheR [Nitrospirae bacterium]|nr:protein-glutamate O-methyltransferase CheR [Nitrospirota bacterium]
MSVFEENITPLPLDIFRLLRDFIKDYCGLFFNDKSLFILERRLNRRLKLHSLKDFREYYHFLMYDAKRDDEIHAIIDILTVNETYFFRGLTQLTAFIDEIMPMIKEEKKTKKINIWSAGCATGEEPYTLVMLILEKGGFEDWDIKILGSDISQRALQVARSGTYRKNSFRTTDNYFIGQYFQKEQSDRYIISDRVRKLVDFSSVNLLNPFKIRLISKMDVIFCRNVLIYFDDESRKKVIENFFDILVDGGCLILGHTESLVSIPTAYSLKHLKNDMVYQKPVKPHPKSLEEVLNMKFADHGISIKKRLDNDNATK